MAEGSVFEKAGVNFSHVKGDALPASATAQRPELHGRSFGDGRFIGCTS